MTATYEYWNNALQGNFGPVHDSDPQPGFWRKRVSRGGAFVPAAIWEQDGQMVAVVDQKPADANEIWTFVCRYPITEAEYHKRVETGVWSDEDAAVTASLNPPPASQEIGANNPPTDPLETLRDSIQAALGGVAEYAKVTSDEAASKAQSLRSRLLELSGDADKRREILKRPHLEAGRAVDEAWNPLVRTAKAGADELRKAISAFETEEKRKRDAAEAERQKKLAEDAKKAAQAQAAAAAAGQPAPEPTPPQPAPEPAPAPKTQVKGAYGKAASIKTVRIADITDWHKVFLAVQGDAEVRSIIQKKAQRALDAGTVLDGVAIREEVTVR